MTECGCNHYTSKFDDEYAAGKLARYRAVGPDRSTRMLLHAITEEGVEGRTLLDIGGGVGAVQHELLALGVTSAQEVEASPAYVAACHAEAADRGHGGRITHLSGDFGSVEDRVEVADIVTLDRSVCCWHDPLDLMDRAAAKARTIYGLVYPRDTWWVRYGWRTWGNARQALKHSGLRLSTPRTDEVLRVLGRHGLSRRHHEEVGVWQIEVYVK